MVLVIFFTLLGCSVVGCIQLACCAGSINESFELARAIHKNLPLRDGETEQGRIEKLVDTARDARSEFAWGVVLVTIAVAMLLVLITNAPR